MRDTEGDAPTPSLTLTDVTAGEQVAGEVGMFFLDRSLVHFTPTEQLKPEHEYVLRGYSDPEAAGLVPTTEAPSDAGTPSPDLEVAFTTGTTKLSKLELVGVVSVVLVPEERDDYSPCDPGLCECEPSGKVLGTKAIVTLPGATGAQADFGYRALVEVRDAEGNITKNAATAVHAEPGTTLEVTAIDAEKEYEPCFSVELRDVSGQTKKTAELCLDETVPKTRWLGDAGTPSEEDGGASGDASAHVYDASSQVTGDTQAPEVTNTSGAAPDSDDGDIATTAEPTETSDEEQEDASTAVNDDGCSVVTLGGRTGWSSVGLVGLALGSSALRRRRR